MPAFRIGWFLYFYRLVGALLFELTHARWLLLVFPNVFEYFFIAYETIRSRWQPVHLLVGWWLSAAALIWVVRQAAAGVLAARRPARRHRRDRPAPLDHRAAHRRPARPRAGLPEAGAAAAPAAGLVAGGSGPSRSPRRSTSRRSRRPGGCGTTRSSRPGTLEKVMLVGLVVGDLLPDAARLHRLDHRRLHRRRGRGRGQLRHHPGRRPPALDDPLARRSPSPPGWR